MERLLRCAHRFAAACGRLPRSARLWSSLKRELVHRTHFATHTQARAAVFGWIEVFYNRERFHSALGYQSPVDFETNLN